MIRVGIQAHFHRDGRAVLTHGDQFTSGAHLPELMFQAIERIPNLGRVRPAFYMSRDIRTVVRQQVAAATDGSTLEFRDVGGIPVMFMHEVPLRRVDKLSVDEARVT